MIAQHLAACCCLLLLFVCVNSDIIIYDHHVITPEQPEYLIVPKFQKSEVPNWKPGRGRSYIDISRLRVQSTCYTNDNKKDPCVPVNFDLLLFEAPLKSSWQNLWDDQNYCCTQELVDAGKCPASSLNRLLLPTQLTEVLQRSVMVYPNESYVSLNEDHVSKFEIVKSGLYIMLVAVCHPKAANVVLEGAIESLDPYGYVPADAFGNLPFYVTLSCLYTIVATVWCVLCYWYRDELMALQYWITLVLMMGMLETTFLLSHYIVWNDSGSAATGLAWLGILCGVAKRSLSRVLVQFVALGYGIVRPTLGEEMQRVLWLGGGYAVCSLLYSWALHSSAANQSLASDAWAYDDLQSIFLFLIAFIDTTFYIWIFTSINNLLLSLASRQQHYKYAIYRAFRRVLFGAVLASIAWALYGSFFFLARDASSDTIYWRAKWSLDAVWEVLYFVIFVALVILWAPTKNALRYAAAQELGGTDEDEDWQAWAGLLLHSGNGSSHGHGSGSGTPGKREEVEMTATKGHSHREREREREQQERLDAEYGLGGGGGAHGEEDPFQGTGALDPAMAIAKKQ